MNCLKNCLGALDAELVQDQEKHLVVKLNVNTEKEWINWLAAFGAITKTRWIVRKTFPTPKHYIFRKIYVCRCNQFRKSAPPTLISSSVSIIDTKCPVKLDVRISHSSKKFENDNKRWCELIVQGNHNHELQIAKTSNILNIKQETVETSEEDFNPDYSQANDVLLRTICTDMKEKLSDSFSTQETHKGLMKFHQSVLNFTSPAQLLMGLHLFGQDEGGLESEKTIKCQPTSISCRLKNGVSRSSAPIRKNHPSLKTRIEKQQRLRNLIKNIMNDLPSSICNGDGHEMTAKNCIS